MRVLELIRLRESEKHGTFGVLRIDKELLCWTLEPADRLNQQSRSCIPAQQYTCRRYSSMKYPDSFEITGVSNRTKILFHAGNTDDDTAGCVLLGETIGKLSGNRALLNSGATFRRFLAELASDDEAILSITEVY